MKSSLLHLLLLISLLALLPGCSRGPKLYPVRGEVTIDGQPVPEGNILLIPTDGKTGPEPGWIREGKYDLKATAGKKKVEISASKILPGGARGAGGEPVPEEYLPPRYNLQTELTAEVEPTGKNVFDFKLKSK